MSQGYSKRDLIKFNFANLNLKTDEFFGNSPPSVFVGRYGYPKVNVGVLSPVENLKDAWILDSPKDWVKAGLKDIDILKLRAQLINSRFKNNIKSFNHRLLDLSQEIGMADKPVEVEVKLKDKPSSNIKMEKIVSPLSNNASVKNIKITENPKVKNIVEKTISDIDLKSVEGIYKMYKKGLDENFLSKVLSIGLLGLKKDRKLVPTRWSITATDDIIAKKLLKNIQYYDCFENTLVYFGGHLGNYYLIIFFPGVWNYELFETPIPFKINPWSKSGKAYAYDYENYYGRKKYADETAGGYYACRLGVIEKLNELKKQSSTLVLRFITQEDKYPLGVWLCREATRISLKENFIEFEDKELAINYVKSLVKKKFGIGINFILKKSKILKNLKNQKRISEFF